MSFFANMKVKDKAGGEAGFALLSVLVIIAIITPLVVNQSYKTRVQITGAGYLADKIKSREIAKSGLEAAILALKKDDKDYDSYLDEWGQFVELSAFSSTFFEEGSFSGTITDEEGKLNINGLGPENVKMDQFTLLFEELNIDTDILDGVLDWIDDVESGPGLMGAEDYYYKSLKNPYNCKDGSMDNIYELRLVKGMTDKVFLGKGEAKGLEDFITVYGEKNNNVNINTAPYEVLRSLDITPALARDIIAYRETEPIKSIIEIKELFGKDAYDDLKSQIKVSSKFFSIKARGNVRDIYTDVHAFIERNGDKITILYYGEA